MSRRPFRSFLAALVLAALPALALAGPAPTSATLVPPVNAARARVGDAPLVVTPRLEAVAMARAKQVAARQYFTHCADDTFDESCPRGYAMAAFGVYGENLALIWPQELNSVPGRQQAFNNWMASPGHYRNIVMGWYTVTGTAEYPFSGWVSPTRYVAPAEHAVLYIQEFA